MTSNRKWRARLHRMQRGANSRRHERALEDRLWDQMVPVGREFGSPDFERLMAEDQRAARGVFDPTLMSLLAKQADGQALLAFFVIACRWRLKRSGKALLLGVDPSDVEHLENAPHSAALSEETRARLRWLLEIADGLQDLLCTEERADAWVHRANSAPMFNGTSALSYMLRGRLSDLSDVAGHLAASRSGDFS